MPDGTAADDLRRLVLDVRGRIQGGRPAVVALFTAANGRPLTVIATNEAARERGLKAGDLVRTAAKTLGGGGGGKPDVAQGGGQNPAAIGDAVAAVERLVTETAVSAKSASDAAACAAAVGSRSTSGTPGSGSPRATPTGSSPPRWRPCRDAMSRPPTGGCGRLVEEYEPIEVVVGLPAP